MITKLMEFVSGFSNRKFEVGTGVSTDDKLLLKAPPSQERIEMAQRESKVIYEFRDSNVAGRFELMDVIRKRDIPMYRLKHTLSGEVLDLTKSAFELIFQKQGTK